MKTLTLDEELKISSQVGDFGNCDVELTTKDISSLYNKLHCSEAYSIVYNFLSIININEVIIRPIITETVSNYVRLNIYKYFTNATFKDKYSDWGGEKSQYVLFLTTKQKAPYESFREKLDYLYNNIMTKVFGLTCKVYYNYQNEPKPKIVYSYGEKSFKDSYKDLCTILSRRNLYKNTFYHNIAVYNLIFNVANEYCAHQFINNTTTDFKSIKSMSIDDCINLYCSSAIQVDSYANIGLFTRFLIHNCKYENSYCNAFGFVLSSIKKHRYENKFIVLESRLLKTSPLTLYNYINIDDIDLMTGEDFEDFIGKLFISLGYSVDFTKKTGDQGIDIIAEKGIHRLAIQTKCYSNKVSNSAIQEVVAGKKHYNCNKAIVITNNYFTQSAISLGISNDVVLWDRAILKEKVSEINICKYNIIHSNQDINNITPIIHDTITGSKSTDSSITDNSAMSIVNFKPLTADDKDVCFKRIKTHAPLSKKDDWRNCIGVSNMNPPIYCKCFDYSVELATKYALKGVADIDVYASIAQILEDNGVDEIHVCDAIVTGYINAVNELLDCGKVTKLNEHILCEYLEHASSYLPIEEYMEYLNATEELIELIESPTNSPDIMFQNARLLDNMNEYTKALKLYERLISKHPFSSEAKHSKIYIDGINSRNNVSNIDVGLIAKNLYNQATLLEKNNEFDNAYTIYNKIIVDYPNSNEAKYSKSKLHYYKEYSNRPS